MKLERLAWQLGRQLPSSEAKALPIRFPASWAASSSDTGEPGMVRTFFEGARAVQIFVYDWVVREDPGILEEVEGALLPLSETDQARDAEPPVLLFDGPMPLPSGANFGGLLSAAGALVLVSCDGGDTTSSEPTAATAPPKVDGDAFGLGPGNTGDRPGYLMASDSGTALADVREQVTAQLPVENPDGGGRYAFLPYRLPAGFAPALDWAGDKLGDHGNPAVSGRFYAAAFSDDQTAIRLVVNPASAPASISWTLPPGGLVWKRTGAGCMQREASEAVRDGVEYHRLQMPDDEIIVYGPQSIRPAIWKLAEELAPVVVGGGADVPATMPADFNFVLRYGVEAKNVLDTRRGRFTHDMISAPSITTDLALAPEELAEIYARLRDIDFWSYPSSLKSEVGVMPSTRYEIAVLGEDLDHAVGGDDLHYAASLRAVALWKLIERVQEMIMATDAYKALPEPVGGYL